MRLDGKRSVITGAAGGIGEGTARLFVREGATVIVADVDDDRGQALAAELGDAARYVHVDVSEEGAIEAAIGASVAQFGGLDCVFNNAGVAGAPGSVEDMDAAHFDRVVSVNLRGVFLGIRAAARVMRPQGHGSIVSTASVAGVLANYGGHDYSATKAAVLSLTRTAANELGEHGVRVNAVVPGAIATAIFGRAAGLSDDDAQASTELAGRAIANAAPIPRTGLPSDVAEAVLWLASDASSYVNGIALPVDGGILTGPLYRDRQPRRAALLDALRAEAAGRA
jgi:NAD(P)-dependent dehydrogenase (short-subunit alcohol dehydrogenase family)